MPNDSGSEKADDGGVNDLGMSDLNEGDLAESELDNIAGGQILAPGTSEPKPPHPPPPPPPSPWWPF